MTKKKRAKPAASRPTGDRAERMLAFKLAEQARLERERQARRLRQAPSTQPALEPRDLDDDGA